MTDAVLVYEVGPGRGLGHKRRMEALASALRDLGVSVELRTTDEPVPADIVVVDAYEVRADDGRFSGRVLAAVDDLERDLAVDLLVDPNPGGDPARRVAACHEMHGLRFALVPSPPAALAPRPVASVASRILITSGAADADGWGPAVAKALRALDGDLDVRLVMGPWGADAAPADVTVVRTDQGLLPALADVDLVVTGGGVTLLEAMLLGRPTLAVAIAGNQSRAVRGAVEAGAASSVPAPADPTTVATVARALARDQPRRRQLAEAATALIDGGGPRRVAEALVALL